MCASRHDFWAPDGAPPLATQYAGIFRRLTEEHDHLRTFVQLMGQSPEERRNRPEELLAALTQRFRVYAAAKEQALYGLLAERAQTRELVAESRARDEHVEEALVALHACTPDSGAWQSRLQELEQRMDELIGREEKNLIPAAEEVLSLSQADDLAEQYDRAREQAEAVRQRPGEA